MSKPNRARSAYAAREHIEHDEQDHAFQQRLDTARSGSAAPGRPAGKIIAQGSQSGAGRPHSSPLMKLAIRPRPSPIGTHTAIRSAKPSSGMRWRRQNRSACATATPSTPPWKLMPPCQTAKICSGMREIERRLVEQHVAEPAAEHHAERRPGEEIVHLLARSRPPAAAAPAGASAASRAPGRRYRRARTSGSRTARPGPATGSNCGNSRTGIISDTDPAACRWSCT